jgi:hypothetical protein
MCTPRWERGVLAADRWCSEFFRGGVQGRPGDAMSGLTEAGNIFLGGGVDFFGFSGRGRTCWRTRVGDSGAGGRDGFCGGRG